MFWKKYEDSTTMVIALPDLPQRHFAELGSARGLTTNTETSEIWMEL